ncbi:hypothetical protein Naga_102373g1 [Nannochloropsis gaditana]|uniref:Uncharacterized protein n=1 Tax=Nannochloropsis gaditana TaxID=72520 RepID=W7SYR5_9STRA|nr:hypothetical protein Naga_102373g1 [Nannochloropsis gaditana]
MENRIHLTSCTFIFGYPLDLVRARVITGSQGRAVAQSFDHGGGHSIILFWRLFNLHAGENVAGALALSIPPTFSKAADMPPPVPLAPPRHPPRRPRMCVVLSRGWRGKALEDAWAWDYRSDDNRWRKDLMEEIHSRSELAEDRCMSCYGLPRRWMSSNGPCLLG